MIKKELSIEEEHYLCEFFESCNNMKERRIRIEIMRQLYLLNRDISIEYGIYYIFQKIHRQLIPNTRYRDFKRLLPILLYHYLTYQNYNVRKQHLQEICAISSREFDETLLHLLNYNSLF
jgi:hypothetical protein